MQFGAFDHRTSQSQTRLVASTACFLFTLSLHFNVLAQDGCDESAQQSFDRGHWEEVTTRLDNRARSACDDRLLALALFHSNRYDSALPRVKSLRAASANDQELNRAALTMLAALGQSGEARDVAAALAASGDTDFANFHLANLAIADGDPDTAESLLRDLLGAPDPVLAQEAGSELIVLLQAQGRYREIPLVAGQAYDRDPDSFSAYRFEQYSLENQRALRSFDVSAGYRLDYDDNVALYPDDDLFIPGSTDEEDFRHVLFGDLWYRRGLGRNFRFFSELHLAHSIHQDYSEYDLTRINVVAGLGGSYSRWGWRAPVEYTHDRFDGETYRDTWAATPGFYIHLPGGLQSHFYGRFREDEYDFSLSPSEDRSGDITGGGVLLVGALNDQWFVRAFGESDEIDTDGRNWDRDEWRAYAQVEYSPSPAWTIGAGYSYQEAEFENIHDVFLQRREDETSEAFASLTYRFGRRWMIRAQVTFVEQESTLPVYTYERTVFSLGINRDF